MQLEEFQAVQAAWPGVSLGQQTFEARLVELVAGGAAPPRFLSDLYLSTACVTGDREALRHFEDSYMSQVPAQLGRFCFDRPDLDEVLQLVRLRLFTGPRPRIAGYAGAAPLGAWLRVVAVRLAIERRRGGQAAVAMAPSGIQALAGGATTPEIGALLERHRADFLRIFETALGSLDRRETTVMRMHVVDGLNLAAIANLYGVHRATVARWVLAVRERVLDAVRAEFSTQLGTTPSDVRSLVSYFGKDLQLTISRVLPR